MQIYDAKFQEHCFNISRDIVYSVFSTFLLQTVWRHHCIIELVRQSQIVQSVMYSYDAVISSYIIPAIHSWFGRSASEKVVFYVDFCSF